MSIPKSIKIRGFKWKVLVTTPEKCEHLRSGDMGETTILGACMQSERKIYINKNTKDMIGTFLHEWGHAWLYECGITSLSALVEEMIVDNMSKEIFLNGWYTGEEE